MKKLINFLCIVGLFLILTSCLIDKKNNQDNSIVGTYSFEFPSKEIEVLIIKSDSTYEKNIFANKENYLNKKTPLYTNIGEWSFNARNKNLNFKDWLSYCEIGDPNIILPEPQNFYMTGISWVPPSIGQNGLIIIYDQNDYVFERVDGNSLD